jgi:cardiolipin-specific phospholipase
MWEAGYSPLALVKGPWGPSLVGKYASRRFAALPEADIRDMHSYIWTISRAKGSGEYAITHLLAPGAHARLPIVNRIHKVQVPVAFLCEFLSWRTRSSESAHLD